MDCPACRMALPAEETGNSSAVERRIGGKNVVCPVCGAVLWLTIDGEGRNIRVDLPLVVVVSQLFPDDDDIDDIIEWRNLTRH